MVGHHLPVLVKDGGNFGFLSDVPAFRASGVIYAEANVLDTLFLNQRLDTLLQLRVIRKEDNAGFDGFVGSSSGIEFLDQTGQAVAQLTGEDERDGSAAELSDKAVFLAVLGRLIDVDDVERVECRAGALPDLRAGLQATLGDGQTAGHNRHQASPKDANAHGLTSFRLPSYGAYRTFCRPQCLLAIQLPTPHFGS